jgi:hypothetical protein
MEGVLGEGNVTDAGEEGSVEGPSIPGEEGL